MDFTVDNALLALEIERMQLMTNNLLMEDEKVRLRIRIRMVKILKVYDPDEGTVDINDELPVPR